MKKNICIFSFFTLLFQFSTSILYSQVGVDLYGPYYNGLWLSLAPGESWTGVTPIGEPNMSWRLNPNCAIRITMLDCDYSNYPHMHIYSEVDQPFVAGTDQYQDKYVRISCEPRGQQDEPMIWIPIDYSNLHPSIDNKPFKPPIGATAIMLRKAFFWENSEDVGFPHGPTGDIKINICSPIVMQYSYEQLINDPSLWNSTGVRFICRTIPGQIYASGATPAPHNEWIDSPWGCYYSNMGVFNWNIQGFENVAIVISEADVGLNDEDFLGAMMINKNDIGIHHMQVGMHGWIDIELKVVTADESSVDLADWYWYYNWDRSYPEIVDAPNGHNDGSQYAPFFSQDTVDLYSDSGDKIGLLGGIFPATTLDKPLIYHAIDEPAIFGVTSGIILYKDANYQGEWIWIPDDIPNLDVANVKFEDCISSVRVVNISSAKLYDHRCYGTSGNNITITQDIPNLTQYGLNNNISSVKVIH